MDNTNNHGSKRRKARHSGEAKPQALGVMAKQWRFQDMTYSMKFLTHIKYYI